MHLANLTLGADLLNAFCRRSRHIRLYKMRNIGMKISRKQKQKLLALSSIILKMEDSSDLKTSSLFFLFVCLSVFNVI